MSSFFSIIRACCSGFRLQNALSKSPVTLRRLRHLSIPRDLGTITAWLKRQHDATEAELADMVAWARTLASPPVISVVMLVDPNLIG